MSMRARSKFWNLKNKLVQTTLLTTFIIMGRRYDAFSFFCNTIRTTLPKLIIMRMYRNVHTGPKSQPGGANDG